MQPLTYLYRLLNYIYWPKKLSTTVKWKKFSKQHVLYNIIFVDNKLIMFIKINSGRLYTKMWTVVIWVVGWQVMFYFAHLNFPVFLQLTFITHIMREKSFLKKHQDWYPWFWSLYRAILEHRLHPSHSSFFLPENFSFHSKKEWGGNGWWEGYHSQAQCKAWARSIFAFNPHNNWGVGGERRDIIRPILQMKKLRLWNDK